MAALEIVMPMAGRGERFRQAGMIMPKPMLEIQGRPMWVRALESLQPLWQETDLDVRVTLVCSDEDDLSKALANQINGYFPNLSMQVFTISGRSRGPADSVGLAREVLNFASSLLVLDCDLSFVGSDYLKAVIQSAKASRFQEGCLCAFESSDPRFSYVVKSDDGFIQEVAEKIVLSNQALLGTYFFPKVGDFLDGLDQVLQVSKKETYVSHVISRLSEQGTRFRVYEVDRSFSFGTPEELNKSILEIK